MGTESHYISEIHPKRRKHTNVDKEEHFYVNILVHESKN